MKIQSTGNEKVIYVRNDWHIFRFPAVARLIRIFFNPGIYLEKLFRIMLYYIFRFDKWHTTILSQRMYALDIIRYCNTLETDKHVLEIGCGLGDIIRNVNALKSCGYDRDVNALKAAAFLSFFRPGRISFSQHEFPKDEIKGHYDVIILVNWIHSIVPSVLKHKIHEIFRMNLNLNGKIIVDTVRGKEYMFNHDIDFLIDGIDCVKEKLGVYNHIREIWIIKKPAV
jgi:SAM-dependent methyltransferase